MRRKSWLIHIIKLQEKWFLFWWYCNSNLFGFMHWSFCSSNLFGSLIILQQQFVWLQEFEEFHLILSETSWWKWVSTNETKVLFYNIFGQLWKQFNSCICCNSGNFSWIHLLCISNILTRYHDITGFISLLKLRYKAYLKAVEVKIWLSLNLKVKDFS